MAQWWERLSPTSVTQVQIPASMPYVGWVCCWFSPVLREVSPLLKKQLFPNSSSTRNQVDEEPLCGCATSKSLFIYLCSMACIEYDLVETKNSVIKFWAFLFLQALTLALTLHEKGRSELKKRNYAEALLLLLEAEKEFRYSRSSPCDHYCELPALFTTTFVKPHLNCYLNFIMKALISDRDDFHDHPTGLFICF